MVVSSTPTTRRDLEAFGIAESATPGIIRAECAVIGDAPKERILWWECRFGDLEGLLKYLPVFIAAV
jgi:hypothetical protein